jgi:hypothetical protein
VERLVVLWLPALSREGPEGVELRQLARALEVVVEHCPFVEPVRLGLLALPARAPSRFYGGEEQVAALLERSLVEAGLGPVRVGIAEGLFAATLAARAEQIVPSEQTSAFLAAHPISVLRRAELASLGQRLGFGTLGRFAALPEERIVERFGLDALACHRVARGLEGELEGVRDPQIPARLALLEEPEAAPVQPAFFGGASQATERAARAALALQHRLGATSVAVARTGEGHDPGEQAWLVPFGAPEAPRASSAPWPGALRAPSPAVVLGAPRPCRLSDARGAPVELGPRGLLSTRPERCSVEGEARTVAVTAWAGPWPLAVRWWEHRGARARLQVLGDDGVGLLLGWERGAWSLLGRYD